MDRQSLYIQAINDAYPYFKFESIQHNHQGQFNDVLLVNSELIFRFPKAQREADKLADEVSLLQHLQALVTLPIPNPIYRSHENADIGQVFMGYPLLAGEPLWPETLQAFHDKNSLQQIADQLASFLLQLHALSPEIVQVNLPDFQGCKQWQDLYERFRRKLFPFMRLDACTLVTKQFEDFFSDTSNCTYTPALIHGDLGPSNILYNAQTNKISGIIDFSEAGWGDPAVDFAALSCSVSYGEPFLDLFTTAYPGIESLLSRARFYANTFALQEALYGIEDGDREAFENGIAEYQ